MGFIDGLSLGSDVGLTVVEALFGSVVSAGDLMISTPREQPLVP